MVSSGRRQQTRPGQWADSQQPGYMLLSFFYTTLEPHIEHVAIASAKLGDPRRMSLLERQADAGTAPARELPRRNVFSLLTERSLIYSLASMKFISAKWGRTITTMRGKGS